MALLNLGADGGVIVLQNGFHQFAFTANDDPGETLEPAARRDRRIGIEPLGKILQIIDRYGPFTNSARQMLDRSPRNVLTPNLRHGQRTRLLDPLGGGRPPRVSWHRPSSAQGLQVRGG